MNKLMSAAVWLLVLMLSGLSGCSEPANKGLEKKQNAPPIKGLTLVQVTESDLPDQLEVVGTVRARSSAVIAARIAGVVTSLSVREGDRVARGKLLLTLEAAETAAGSAAATAAVQETREGVAEALARQRLADTTYERFQRLYDERAVTRQEMDMRRTDKELAAQGVARAEAQLTRARETARGAGTVAGYARITAPVSGMVTARSVDVGMTVFPGMPLLTVEEEGHYRLEALVPETLLGRLKTGDALPVVIEGNNNALMGRVAELVPVVDPLSRTFTAKVDIAAKGLRSGLFGRAQIPVGSRKSLLVPKSALFERGALTLVWVVDRENRLRLRLVKAGKGEAERVEILTGLSAGERVVSGGLEKVVDGAKVE
jgi:membrane fusion protein, multidrug efflux system